MFVHDGSKTKWLAASVLVLGALVGGCASGKPAEPAREPGPGGSAKSASRKPAELRRLYRLDFVIATTEPGKPASTSAHTMNLEESSHGEIRVGTNVPLSTQARMNVGLLVRCGFVPVGDDLLLDTDVELTSADDMPAIRKLTMRGNALVAAGRSSLVASAEDPGSHKRVEVTVTATKLR